MDVLNLGNDIVINEVKELNKETIKYGLVLSDFEIRDLVNNKNNVLKSVGRIEMDKSAVTLIISEFCKSSYISSEEWAGVVKEIITLFYNVRNEISDNVSDFDLVKFMYNIFENKVHGVVELLSDEVMNEVYYE